MSDYRSSWNHLYHETVEKKIVRIGGREHKVSDTVAKMFEQYVLEGAKRHDTVPGRSLSKVWLCDKDTQGS